MKMLVRWLSLFALLLAGCRADLATKAWAAEELRASPRTLVPHVLELRYAENRAIAFSMLRDIPERTRKPLIFALAGTALAVFAVYAWIRRKQGLLAAIPLALVLAGACGNLIDRFQKGYVVDFVHVHWRDAWSFPIFNLADSLISVGMAILLWQSVRAPKPDRASPAG
jgi:signal peptidase II